MPTVPMKVHSWQHLLQDLRRFRGLKSHNENHIERAHQVGKRHEKRLQCFRDFQKKAENILRHTATANHPPVEAMQEDTMAKRKKRRRGAESVAETEDRVIDRAVCLKEILVLPPFDCHIPSLLELAKKAKQSNYR